MTLTEFPLAFAARQNAKRIAYRDPKIRVSYEQLSSDVEVRRSQLVSSGLKEFERVSWCPKNDYPTLVNLWAILSAKAIACPISHRLPPPQRLEIANQIQARWLDEFELDNSNTSSEQPPGDSYERPATIVMSSGSTGRPKAIVHDLAAHIASAQGAATRIPLKPGDGWLWALPTFHVGGLSIPFRCVLSGATVCGVESHAGDTAHHLRESEATHVSLVPTQLQRLFEHDHDLSKVKSILVGGMAVPPRLIQEAVRREVTIHTTYGLTEMASQVTTSVARQSPRTTSGTPLPFRQVCIGDDDEILVRGPTLCLGYLVGDEIVEATDKDGWFHTRDRGRFTHDGELEVLGRMDNMFISGGENIYPESIETELMRFPEIARAMVVPRTDLEFGSRPVCFVEIGSEQPCSLEQERWNQILRGRLSGFEIPVAYMPWPEDAELGIKPDRRKLTRLANENV